MKAQEIMDKLYAYGEGADYSWTCDTMKTGAPNTEVTKVAVTMMATVDVIKAAVAWGAQLLITHEPTFFSATDGETEDVVEQAKRKLIADLGLTIYRFHDHAHYEKPDIICEGEIRKMQLPGDVQYTDVFDLVRIKLHEPTAPVEVARLIEQRLNLKHIRIFGNLHEPITNVSLMPGTPGGVFEELKREETDLLITGEAGECIFGEYLRDAAALGFKKTAFILGHVGSERDGMLYTTELLKEHFPALNVKYFECGEVLQYTDDT